MRTAHAHACSHSSACVHALIRSSWPSSAMRTAPAHACSHSPACSGITSWPLLPCRLPQFGAELTAPLTRCDALQKSLLCHSQAVDNAGASIVRTGCRHMCRRWRSNHTGRLTTALDSVRHTLGHIYTKDTCYFTKLIGEYPRAFRIQLKP